MRTFLLLLLLSAPLFGQSTPFPYRERFDSVSAPSLPAGWSTSTNKNTAGDFAVSSSSPRSGSLPNCVSAADARVSQWLLSPPISFAGRSVDSIEFYERRTGSFTAGLLLEATAGADTLFPFRIGDTLKLTAANNGAYQRRNFALPAELNGLSPVRFRWRVVGTPSGGGTAVLRLEDVTVTVRKSIDLAVSSVTVRPSPLRAGDSAVVTAAVVNRAAAGLRSGTVTLYDSLERVTVQHVLHTFAERESLMVTLPYPHPAQGRHPLSVQLVLAGDEDTTNNHASVILQVGARPRSLVLNEIMYTPSSGMPEWAELVNASADTVTLAGWRISDAGATKAVITGTSFLPPGAFAVVTTDTNTFKSRFDISAPLFQAPFSAFNNSGDAVVLYDRFGGVVDSLWYRAEWGGTGGRSLERIRIDAPSEAASSWSSCRHPDGGTPGAINSVSQKPTDAAVRWLAVSPLQPVAGSAVTITALLVNIGKNVLPPVRCVVQLDTDADSVFEDHETAGETAASSLPSGDSTLLQFPPLHLRQGRYAVTVRSLLAEDDDTLNNVVFGRVQVGIASGSVLISEVMVAPPGEEGEWVELYNSTADTVSLSGWSISDNGSTRHPFPDGSFIAPGGFAVIAADAGSFFLRYPGIVPLTAVSFPSFNNTTPDAVVLRDERGTTMDSLRYLPSWSADSGTSLQRYDLQNRSNDSANWLSTVPNPGTGSPAGRKEHDAGILRTGWEPFAGGIRITTALFNHGRLPMNGIAVRFFIDEDRDAVPDNSERFAELTADLPAPLDSLTLTAELHTPFTGRRSLLVRLIHAHDEQRMNDSGVIIVDRRFPARSMVINEVLYEPLSGSAEYVEVLNRSTDTVNAEGWSLMDQLTASGSRTIIPLASSPLPVPPGGMIVIANDSSILMQYPHLSSVPTIIHPSLSLSNSGEDIVITDLTGAMIDSLRYLPTWHLTHFPSAGRSLERIDPSGTSTDPRNWSSSVAPGASTPGRPNSILLPERPLTAALTLSPNPFSPDQDGSEDFCSIHYTLPSRSATLRVRIYDITGRMVRRLAWDEPAAASGSLIWNGADDNGHRVRIGMYIVLIEALDHAGGTVSVLKDIAVVARRLR